MNEDDNAAMIRNLKKEVGELHAKLARVDDVEVVKSQQEMDLLKQELEENQQMMFDLSQEWEDRVSSIDAR